MCEIPVVILYKIRYRVVDKHRKALEKLYMSVSDFRKRKE